MTKLRFHGKPLETTKCTLPSLEYKEASPRDGRDTVSQWQPLHFPKYLTSDITAVTERCQPVSHVLRQSLSVKIYIKP